jgi:hypothetical protein
MSSTAILDEYPRVSSDGRVCNASAVVRLEIKKQLGAVEPISGRLSENRNDRAENNSDDRA